MKVLANRYLYKFRELFPDKASVDLFEPGNLPGNVSEYDALFINTTTRINENTLPDPGNIRFIATGSSGTDHIDLRYLESHGIKAADAAGCNASAVAEYIITSLLCYQDLSNIHLHDLKVGIVGIGHVGTAVSQILTRFSVPHISYDPPRAEQEPRFQSAHFEEIKECDILTFHTPLSYSGDYPTHHLVNRSWFRGTNYQLLINTARGGVVDENILLEELELGRLKYAVIDVWEDEPNFNIRLANQALFSTPHIAGYSVQAKQKATEMIIQEFCHFTGIQMPRAGSHQTYSPKLQNQYSRLADLLLDLHPIGSFSKNLLQIATEHPKERGNRFATLRSESELRHEYSTIRLPPQLIHQFPELKLLGIQPCGE